MSRRDSTLTALTGLIRAPTFRAVTPPLSRSRPTRTPDADVGFPGLTPLRAGAAVLGHRARVRPRVCRAETGRQYGPGRWPTHLESDQAYRSVDDAAAPRAPVLHVGWRGRARRSETGARRSAQLSKLPAG